VSDDVICAFGRLGTCSVSEVRLRARHHHVREGITAGYAPLGAMIVSTAWPSPSSTATLVRSRIHLVRSPVSCAVALKSIEIMENEKVLENVLDNEDYFRQSLLNLKDIPIVATFAAPATLGVELVKNR